MFILFPVIVPLLHMLFGFGTGTVGGLRFGTDGGMKDRVDGCAEKIGWEFILPF